MLRIIYFARVREAIGIDGEERDVATGTTIGALVDALAAEHSRYAEAFADRGKLRFALDQTMAHANAVLDGASELAIFPPVTGG